MIPKKLHIIWIENKTENLTQYIECIETWHQHNPEWEINIWGHEELAAYGWINAQIMRSMSDNSVHAVYHLMRWEILYNEGGFVIDSDTVCIRALPDWITECRIFTCWENEKELPGEISVSYVASEPKNPLIGQVILDIQNDKNLTALEESDAVGAKRLVRTWQNYSYQDLTVFPSHFFIPRHPKAAPYTGTDSVFMYKKWTSLLGQHYSPSNRETRSFFWKTDKPPLSLTIAIPCYNSSAFIAKAIESALSQTYENFEILILDDGSTDDSIQVITSFEDSRIRILRQENSGIPKSRNRLLEEAQGDYILWLDSDDALTPDVVVRHMAFAAAWPEVAMFYAGLIRFDSESGQVIEELPYKNYFGDPLLLSRLFIANQLPMPGSMVKRSVMLALGGFDESLSAAEDYDLWARIVGKNLSVMHIGGFSCYYRWHYNNISHQTEKTRKGEITVLRKLLNTHDLGKLCADLDWKNNFGPAKIMATERVGALFRQKDDLDYFMQWAKNNKPNIQHGISGIVTCLIGGLGNQMFQYAAGRALANRLGIPLYIDRRGFEEYKLHQYGLHHFSLNTEDMPPEMSLQDLHVVDEKHFHYNPDFFMLGDGSYIRGYWQTEKYFTDIRSLIFQEFQISTPISIQNQLTLNKINSANSVSLHIRRGDYVSNPEANVIHGTCSLEYYQSALSYMQSNVGDDIVVFVFSDDLTWVAENMNFSLPVIYVANNDADHNYEDLRLMSACQHHIIANSSFSWWGAWLGCNPAKKVIAPKRWFANAPHNTCDLLPSSWITM